MFPAKSKGWRIVTRGENERKDGGWQYAAVGVGAAGHMGQSGRTDGEAFRGTGGTDAAHDSVTTFDDQPFPSTAR